MTQTGVLPRWIYLPAALGAAFVVLPLVAMAVRVDWPRFWSLIASDASTAALTLSLRTAAASTVLCVLAGVPLALVLARRDGRMVRLARPLILLPLVLPPVVGGISLLYAFGRLGLVGRYLEAAGVQIAFSTTAVVLAQTFVSLPFLVISLEGAARTAVDAEQGEAAAAPVAAFRCCGCTASAAGTHAERGRHEQPPAAVSAAVAARIPDERRCRPHRILALHTAGQRGVL